ncbi:MAG: hypothetical protein QXV46_06430 [Candidatus Bathyarchaeia archaeon]
MSQDYFQKVYEVRILPWLGAAIFFSLSKDTLLEKPPAYSDKDTYRGSEKSGSRSLTAPIL